MAQLQFKSTDTVKWLEGYGPGGSDITVSSNATASFANAGCSGTSGQYTLTLDAASTFANGDIIGIMQMRGTGAFAHQLNVISSGGGSTTLTLKYPLTNTYTDSGASQAQVFTFITCNTYTVNSGITLSAPEWDANKGGIIPVIAKTSITVNGTLNGTGKGFLGGSQNATTSNITGKQGEGSGGARDTNSASANGTGGGGGGANNSGTGGNAGGGGGGGANGVNGTDGQGVGYAGTAGGTASLVLMPMGGGGGGGGNDDSVGAGAAGGDGGGIVFLIAPSIDLSSGSVTINGNNGASYVYQYAGAGGGGAGGSFLAKCKTINVGTNKITVAAGSGGARHPDGGGVGGNGSVGRIHIDYKTSITGSATPTIDSTQDATLDYPTSSNFLAFF